MTSKAKKHTPTKKTPIKTLNKSPLKKSNSPIWRFRTKTKGKKHGVVIFSINKQKDPVIKQLSTLIDNYSQDRPIIFTLPNNNPSTPIKNKPIIPTEGRTPGGTEMYPGRSFNISFGELSDDNTTIIEELEKTAWIYSPSKPKILESIPIDSSEEDYIAHHEPKVLFDGSCDLEDNIENISLEQSTDEDSEGGEELTNSSTINSKQTNTIINRQFIILECPKDSRTHSSKRNPNQNTVMGENAKTAIVNSGETDLTKGANSMNQEWLHLIAHSLARCTRTNKFNPQSKDNLVAASSIDNTKMLTLELAASAFLSVLPEGFTIELETKAETIKETNNVASYIWQNIIFKDPNNHKFIKISQEFPTNKIEPDDKKAASTKDLDLTVEIILMAFSELYGKEFIMSLNISSESTAKSSSPKFK